MAGRAREPTPKQKEIITQAFNEIQPCTANAIQQRTGIDLDTRRIMSFLMRHLKAKIVGKERAATGNAALWGK